MLLASLKCVFLPGELQHPVGYRAQIMRFVVNLGEVRSWDAHWLPMLDKKKIISPVEHLHIAHY